MNRITLASEAMRTRFEAVLWDEQRSAVELRAAGEEAVAEVTRVETWLSAFRPDSDLFGINASGANAPVRVDARVFRLLQRAQELSAATNGAFDMTVGPLLALWAEERVPTPDQIADAKMRVGMTTLVRLDPDAQTVTLTVPGARLDPGAIGKGYALDRAAAILHDAGITNALLHGGTSTLVALGTAPDRADGWPIALQDPRHADRHLTTVVLRDASLSVSAVHGKTFWAEGRRFGHVLDPRTGRPVENTLLAAVVAPSATETDALSTALLVQGEARMPEMTARFPALMGLLTVTSQENKTHCVSVGVFAVAAALPSGDRNAG